jgi:hypothetical protein
MRTSQLAMIVLFGLAACKDKGADTSSAGGTIASCNIPGLATCRQYSAANLELGSDSLVKLCTLDASAKFAPVACPTVKRVGSCAKPEGKDYYYEGYAIPLDEIEKDCKAAGGTFQRGG